MLNKVKIDKVNCVKDNKVMEQDELSNFIDGVINNNLEPKVNEVVVGFLSNTIIDYLISNNISYNRDIVEIREIKLTYKGLEHLLRDEKKLIQKLTQKLTQKQIKRIAFIIAKNNVYYDVDHKNILFIDYLPEEEVEGNVNIIKIPIKLIGKKALTIATASRVSDISILNSPKKFKKIN